MTSGLASGMVAALVVLLEVCGVIGAFEFGLTTGLEICGLGAVLKVGSLGGVLEFGFTPVFEV